TGRRIAEGYTSPRRRGCDTEWGNQPRNNLVVEDRVSLPGGDPAGGVHPDLTQARYCRPVRRTAKRPRERSLERSPLLFPRVEGILSLLCQCLLELLANLVATLPLPLVDRGLERVDRLTAGHDRGDRIHAELAEDRALVDV